MFHRKLIRELKLSRGRTLQGECSEIRRPIQDREISFFCQCSYNETELSWDVNQADAAEKTRADRDGLHSEVYCSGCPLSTQVLRCSTAQRYTRPLARRTRAVVFFCPMMSQQPQIQRFWSWFESHLTDIANACEQSDAACLNHAITPQVRRLGSSINWEFGPYHHPDQTFVLSPTIRENLPITRAAAAAAPVIDGWHFLPARPRKPLRQLVFEAHGITVSAENWQYLLTAYNGGEFVDVEIRLDEPISHAPLFAELVVEALVGEQRRLERIGHVTALPSSAQSFAQRTDQLTDIQHLYDHLNLVLR